MGVCGIDHDFGRSAAKPLFSLQPIHAALPWAKLAFFKDRVGLLNPGSQIARLLQSPVGRIPLLSLFRSTEKSVREKERATQDD
jgi:hypothetical protein